LPEYFVEAGYQTGWIGKWHLGASPAHSPWQRGFQETFGFIGGGHQFRNWKPNENQYTLPLLRNGQPIEDVPPHLTTAFGEEAVQFVRRNQASPWFLYLAFNAPHTPHQPTPEREAEFAQIENPQRRRCLAQISLMDDAIGAILQALDDSGQRQRTLIIFLGDNGGAVATGADNGTLHGQKGEVYEGGVRVPFVISWPERIAAQTNFAHPVCSLDVLATALAAAEIPIPTDRTFDSVNLLPYLLGENRGTPHQQLCWRGNKGNDRALREGNWKLICRAGEPVELYDLQTDPGEQNNLAERDRILLERLQQSLTTWESAMSPPAFLGSSVKSEDWGPGGANERKRQQKKLEQQRQKTGK
jgi:arylsulfatase A-like enzyme